MRTMLSQLQTMNLLIILQTDSSPNYFLLSPHATPKTLIHQRSQSLPSHHQWQKRRRRREIGDISSSSSSAQQQVQQKCNADFDDDCCGKHESNSTGTRSLLLPLRHGYFPLLYVCFSQATPACCCCCCCCTPTPLFFV